MPTAAGHDQRMLFHQHGGLQICQHAVADVGRIRGLGQIAQHQHKLIAGLATQDVTLPDRRLQTVAHGQEACIAQFVPPTLVELAKVVQVDAANRDRRTLRPGRSDHLPQLIFQQEPVGKTGNGVVVGAIDDLLIQVAMFDRHTSEVAKREHGLPGSLIQQALLVVEYGHRSLSFARAGEQRPGNTKLGAKFKDLAEVGVAARQVFRFHAGYPRRNNGGAVAAILLLLPDRSGRRSAEKWRPPSTDRDRQRRPPSAAWSRAAMHDQ